MSGWIGVDLDGTLAQYDTWVAADHIGEPVKPMLERVKAWLAEGREVRIFTARVFPITWVIDNDTARGLGHEISRSPRHADAVASARAIREWCSMHLRQALPITCIKDFQMVQLWDDRAVQVRPNTGVQVGEGDELLDWFAANCMRQASIRIGMEFKACNAWSIGSHGTDLREAIRTVRDVSAKAQEGGGHGL